MATKTHKAAMGKILFHLNEASKIFITQIPKIKDPHQGDRLKDAKKLVGESIVQVSIINSQLLKK